MSVQFRYDAAARKVDNGSALSLARRSRSRTDLQRLVLEGADHLGGWILFYIQSTINRTSCTNSTAVHMRQKSLPPNRTLQTYLGNRNFYHNQRDTFAWYLAIEYVVNLLDAYVDASLYNFEVSPNLQPTTEMRASLRIPL